MATTARMSSASEPLLDVAALLWKVAAAIAADGLVRERQLRAGVLQVRSQDFGGEAVVGENERLLILPNELEGDPAGFVQVAATDAELLVDYRWVIENKVVIARKGRRFQRRARRAFQ